MELLESFRKKVDQYLFLGYAPPVSPEAHEYDQEALLKMNIELQKKPFQELRRTISEMTPSVKRVLTEFNLSPIVLDYPPPTIGGPVMKFHLLDLVTENNAEFQIRKSKIFDIIDQAIGKLKYGRPQELEARKPTKGRYVFISHSSKDSTVVSAINQALQDMPVKPYFVEDKPGGVPPTKEIAQAVEDAEALFVFFTWNSICGETRDWILFEIGLAIGDGRSIYCWKQQGVTKEQLPRLLEQVTKYQEFATTSDGILKLAGNIRAAAKDVAGLDMTN